MWYIFLNQSPDARRAILAGREYVIGRQSCDIAIADDPTVSRRHAKIKSVCQDETVSNPSQPFTLHLTDNSKFGTWVNETRITDEREITGDDIIKFGTVNSIYRVVYEPFIVTSSCLDNPSKMAVKSSLRQLGGHMVNDWSSNCDLLIMTNLSVTIKVVLAIVCQKHVVTPAYLRDLTQALTDASDLPDPCKYLPPLAESQLNASEISFAPNPARQRVFDKLRFSFINPKQMKKLKMTIELSGGEVNLLEGDTGDVTEAAVGEPNSIVMQCDSNDSGLPREVRKMAAHVSVVLRRSNKRAVADSEIGYAILYCSTERHCNPAIKPGGHAFSKLPSQTFSTQQHSVDQSEVLAHDTETSQLRYPPPTRPPIPAETPQPVKVKQDVLRVTTNQNTPAPGVATQSQVTVKTEPLSFVVSERDSNWSVAVETHRDADEGTVLTIANKPDGRNQNTEDDTVLKAPIKQEYDSEIVKTDVVATKRNIAKINTENWCSSVKPGEVNSPVRSAQSKRPIDDGESAKKTTKRRKRQANMYDSDSADESSKIPLAEMTKMTKTRLKKNVYDSDSDGDKPMERILDKPDEISNINTDNAIVKVKNNPSEVKDFGVSSSNGNVKIDTDDADGNMFSSDAQVKGNNSGFLNTCLLKRKHTPVCGRYEKEPELPSACVQSKYVDLLVERPLEKPRAIESEKRVDGLVMWNGQLVKNFKCFQKNHYVGANQLPRIIGGRDLQVHMNSKNRNVEDMFRAELQAESQYSQETRVADALFEMSFKEKGNKRLRR